MTYQIDPELFELFPSYKRAVLLATEIDNVRFDLTLQRMLSVECETVLSSASISIDIPQLACWSDAYDLFPIKQRSGVRCSAATLVRRVKKGHQIPFISPLVCISNYMALKHLFPCGLFDLDKTGTSLRLGMARGDELFRAVGSDQTLSPATGEIILTAEVGRQIICRAWNSRASQVGLVSPGTSKAILEIDTLDADRFPVNTAAHEARELVQKFCNAKTTIFFLDRDSQSMRLPV